MSSLIRAGGPGVELEAEPEFHGQCTYRGPLRAPHAFPLFRSLEQPH